MNDLVKEIVTYDGKKHIFVFAKKTKMKLFGRQIRTIHVK